MTARAEGAEESSRYAEENSCQSGNEAELERLRAVADEKRKWEEREAKLSGPPHCPLRAGRTQKTH